MFILRFSFFIFHFCFWKFYYTHTHAFYTCTLPFHLHTHTHTHGTGIVSPLSLSSQLSSGSLPAYTHTHTHILHHAFCTVTTHTFSCTHLSTHFTPTTHTHTYFCVSFYFTPHHTTHHSIPPILFLYLILLIIDWTDIVYLVGDILHTVFLFIFDSTHAHTPFCLGLLCCVYFGAFWLVPEGGRRLPLLHLHIYLPACYATIAALSPATNYSSNPLHTICVVVGVNLLPRTFPGGSLRAGADTLPEEGQITCPPPPARSPHHYGFPYFSHQYGSRADVVRSDVLRQDGLH